VEVQPRQRVQQRRAHELPVGADRHRREAGLLDRRRRVASPLGLQQRQAELAGGDGDRRRRRLPAAPGWPVGLRQHQRDGRARRHQAAQAVGAERRRSREPEAQLSGGRH
jgi:hypothetical protein